ncbi:hypothetical protein [Roseibacillus ishigakijimensis]|uniref:Uncharacterized protein n=1 Tax=Roseibacillus ishigakijimensis TaxID=454146 RepID=A0A934RUG1_9BACT|nr:hypothetical protein [Roseibacillus ishigakijimensis]MBK1834696.1 hypothetical protein [Roseibacillus ishigakijimensis]
MMHNQTLFLLPFLLASLPTLADEVYQERGGIVAMEAEATASPLGEWILKTDVADYKGEGHLEFTGNTITNGPPSSPLSYRFTIKKEGVYNLTLRGRKRLESEREDLSNDCFVSLSGDFAAGGSAGKEILTTPTKMYGGNAEEWGWTKMLDVNHKKHEAKYLLKKGETYELIIQGRSKNFNIDRILFVHEDYGLEKAWKKNPRTSKTKKGEKGEKAD